MAVRASAFAVQHRVMVSLEPDTAWLRLTHVQDGWDSQLIGSGASKDLSLRLSPGGCFCEKLAPGG
jgi:hypothetical protein